MTQITAVADSLNKWFKLTIKLNTLKTMTLDTSQSSGYPPISPGPQKTYDFPFPANQEFVGFSISGVNNVAPVVGPPPFPAAPCPVTMLQVLVRSATCTVNFDFS